MKVYLKKNEERRLLSGHQWIFSNEIGKTEGDYINGDVCELYNYSGEFLGKGFYNKNSLISYRHLTSDRNEEINKNYFERKISEANNRRKILNRDVYRMINSESDFLPGLIIDRFEKAFSLQIFSLGMQRFVDVIKEILIDKFNADYIIEKNESDLRTMEGLDKTNNILYNREDEFSTEFIVNIDDIKYSINLFEGQKTGFYLDQVENRKLIRDYIKNGDRVLDLFCNEGGFALNAAFGGASDIIAVDSSEVALETAKRNSELNNFNNINFISSDVFKYLENYNEELFDFIVLDPPSFTKSKKNIQNALKGYIKLNTLAMKLVKRGGYLFTFTCSHHIDEGMFEVVLSNSSKKSGQRVQILHFSNCSVDHPIIPGFTETKYLKSYLLRIV
jgi:23S rRNA (cytosine1962-C5)-methyltransferase